MILKHKNAVLCHKINVDSIYVERVHATKCRSIKAVQLLALNDQTIITISIEIC